jgi:hypothetical protein
MLKEGYSVRMLAMKASRVGREAALLATTASTMPHSCMRYGVTLYGSTVSTEVLFRYASGGFTEVVKLNHRPTMISTKQRGSRISHVDVSGERTLSNQFFRSRAQNALL